MREPVLRLTSLAKVLPGGRRLFDGLTLTLEAGEHVAIRGESGAGKSTLLNIIAGLDTADSGEVMVAGTDLVRLDEVGRTALRRDAIGFVFQAFHILPHLDLVRNVAFPLILQKQPRTVGARARRRDARCRRARRPTVQLSPRAFGRRAAACRDRARAGACTRG